MFLLAIATYPSHQYNTITICSMICPEQYYVLRIFRMFLRKETSQVRTFGILRIFSA